VTKNEAAFRHMDELTFAALKRYLNDLMMALLP